MKRTREVAVGENIPSCIVVLKSQHGYFGWEDQRQRSHGGARSLMLRNELKAQTKCDALLRNADGASFCVLNSSCSLPAAEAGSSAEASEEVCAISKGISQSACTGSGFLQPLSSGKFETAVHVHDDGGKKEQKKKMKRKKHRPKVVEDKKTERKSKMDVPMPPQTPKPKTPGMKKGKKKEKVIRKVTFARKKLFSTSLEDDTEWEEAGDTPNPDSSSEAIDPPSRVQNDEYELVADMNAEHWESGLIEEDMQAGSVDRYNDINLSIDELFQELAKLPMKSSLPLLKVDLLQLNMECPIETLSYIVDNIDIPCLLYFLKQAGRMKAIKMTKSGHKLRAGLFHSGNKVLEDFIRVLKKYLPCLLLRNDKSSSSGAMLNNRQNGGRKRNANGTKEPKGTFIKEAKCQIVPYAHFKASCKKTVICNYTTKGQVTQNMGNFNLNSNQDCKSAMELVLQSVVDNLRMVDINREGIDTPAELQNALVPFVGGGMMVPYNRSSEQAKQKPHRAEVLLDSETNRVWRFLKENEGDDCEDNMDSCKKKWWENERRVFLGRAKSFTARMNIILGDRRFCPWKGSVVDSVVGVFLTQNVSDHLSSSAFISLAAKFPLHGREDGGENSDRKPAEQCEETSLYAIECINSISNLPCCDGQDPIDIQLNGHPLEDLVSQSHHLQNSLNSTKMDNENTIEIDVNECIPARLANISKDFGENAQNICKDLPPILSESLPCSNINVHSVDTMEVEREATVSCKHELKVHFRLNKNTSSAKMANLADDGKIDWEGMRRKVEHDGGKKERDCDSQDSVNWEAVRSADVNKISEAIRERGMSNVLAERIKDFLNRLVRDHGTINLEWLRKICPDEAKQYLLSVRGLGLKSVECVRLLTLQNVAFPVDTNVARISVRLGWVPLKPLPESLQLHLLEQYPIMDSVQKYIWPRLCKLNQKELYELHYHMITFGKVFCTKSRPNCTICPMRGECKHFNSAKLTLPAPEDEQFKLPSFPDTPLSDYGSSEPLQLQYDNNISGVLHDKFDPIIEYPPSPIIEEPPSSPPHEALHIFDTDIEDAFYEEDEMPTIKLNLEKFGSSLQNLVQQSDTKILDNDISNALIELSTAASSVPFRKLKNISGLRTEHYVYELPDSHPLLKEMDQREADDPSPYLFVIWTPGETAVSTEQLGSCCQTYEIGKLCERESCFACNNRRELDAQIVRGTLLIPCRTAMRGRFPLNGTYFQINEVFADHESSRTPLHVPRSVIWNLPRRIVYFGTSIAAIFRGFIATEPIQYCFQRGFICVRGFDRKTREPKPLYARLHLPKSKAPNNKKPWSRQEE